MQNLNLTLDLCGEFVRMTWISVVMGGFGTPPGAPQLKFGSINKRQEYADSIKFGSSLNIPDAGQFGRTVIAMSKIAEEAERGKPPWDMKPMLLNGPKARLSKKGIVYNIIPFRHGAPSRNNQSNAHFRTMPKDIFAAAKALTPSIGTGQHVVSWGGRLSHKNSAHKELLAKYGAQSKMVAMHIAGATQNVKYTHSAGIYDKMVKTTAPYGTAKQSQYMTFRRVSENSPAASWWNPGREGQPHIQWVADYCRPKIEAKLKEAVIKDFATLTTFNMGIRIGV